MTWATCPNLATDASMAARLFAVLTSPPGTANTTVVEAPAAAGSFCCSTVTECCASVPGMVTSSLVRPPLAEAMAPATTRTTSHPATVILRWRKHHRASRYR
ncbi:hypothetical protein [Allobranchiibius sp. GilTou38]|uniref:hypothetical protein n=1 Tax=Allobranchiibius sp. GilTou38 TaxID=2815210 RepID=UPI001FB67358|nr:hypothetical protein [Allobranchiibius sp. GilTou38]